MVNQTALFRRMGFAVLASMFFAWAATAQGAAGDEGKAPEVRRDVLYVCSCGSQCKCTSVSTKPGKCSCGSPLKAGHVVKTEGNDALLCMCGESCKCSGDAKDPTKCGCGNALKRVSLKGTGIHFCNCGGSCACNVVSDTPGKCRCGMDLKKVD
jgi:hypothetical protein